MDLSAFLFFVELLLIELVTYLEKHRISLSVMTSKDLTYLLVLRLMLCHGSPWNCTSKPIRINSIRVVLIDEDPHLVSISVLLFIP